MDNPLLPKYPQPQKGPFQPDYVLHDYVPTGSLKWFEYHCFESSQSCDAHLWYRSHQPVLVLGLAEDYSELEGTTAIERGEFGQPLVYRVRFLDGFEGDVWEDELMESPADYYRPDPMRPKIYRERYEAAREALGALPKDPEGAMRVEDVQSLADVYGVEVIARILDEQEYWVSHYLTDYPLLS